MVELLDTNCSRQVLVASTFAWAVPSSWLKMDCFMASPQHRKSKAYEEERSRLIPAIDGQCFSAAVKPPYLQQVHGVHLPHMEYRTVSMPEFLLAPSFPISGKLAIATSELSK